MAIFFFSSFPSPMKTSRCVFGGFRLPTDRTWSKQHPKIRTPRPLVDRFNLGRMHPHKEWWRERRLAPATFMGFPDVTKAEVAGYNLYTEQMDAATLAVILDKCVEEKIMNEEFWGKFSWRTQQLINKINETEICYLFRSFSRRNWIDSHLMLSLWGRADFLLPRISLEDASVLLEGYANENFFNHKYERRVLEHIDALVTVRNDWTVSELMKVASVIGRSSRSSATLSDLQDLRKRILSTVMKKVIAKPGDLFDVSGHTVANTLASMSVLGIPENDAKFVLCLVDELRDSRKLSSKSSGYHNSVVVAIKALIGMKSSNLCPDLFQDLLIEYYDNIYQLSHSALCDILTVVDELDSSVLPPDHAEVLLLRISREIYKMDKDEVCVVLRNLLQISNGSDMVSKCVGECIERLAVTGLEGVSGLDELRSAIAAAPPQLHSDNLSKLGLVVELVL